MRLIPTWLRTKADNFGITDFARDSEIVRNYLGVNLTRDQFDRYSKSFLLKDMFSKDKKTQLELIHGSKSAAEAYNIALALRTLSDHGVVFEVTDSLRGVIRQSLNTYAMNQFELLDLPAPYKEDPQIAQVIAKNYPYLEKNGILSTDQDLALA